MCRILKRMLRGLKKSPKQKSLNPSPSKDLEIHPNNSSVDPYWEDRIMEPVNKKLYGSKGDEIVLDDQGMIDLGPLKQSEPIIVSVEEFEHIEKMLTNPSHATASLKTAMKEYQDTQVSTDLAANQTSTILKEPEDQFKEQPMYRFSDSSKEQLETCHPDLQKLFNEVIKYRNCTIIQGERNKKQQDEFFRTGKSKVQWPNSKHNSSPSMAVDVAPYIPQEGGIPWKKEKYFYYFGGFVQGIAAKLGIKIRWGYDWDGDTDLEDQTIYDGPHFELIE